VRVKAFVSHYFQKRNFVKYEKRFLKYPVPAHPATRALTFTASGVASGMLCCSEKRLRSAASDQMDDGKAV
jgi:hypothetical protein